MKGVEAGLISRNIHVQERGSIWHTKEFGFHSGVMGAIHGAEEFEVDLYFKSCIREEMPKTSKQPGQ